MVDEKFYDLWDWLSNHYNERLDECKKILDAARERRFSRIPTKEMIEISRQHGQQEMILLTLRQLFEISKGD